MDDNFTIKPSRTIEISDFIKSTGKQKKDGIHKRIGPDKGGHWEIVNG